MVLLSTIQSNNGQVNSSHDTIYPPIQQPSYLAGWLHRKKYYYNSLNNEKRPQVKVHEGADMT